MEGVMFSTVSEYVGTDTFMAVGKRKANKLG
jgi:hypothetical protein